MGGSGFASSFGTRRIFFVRPAPARRRVYTNVAIKEKAVFADPDRYVSVRHLVSFNRVDSMLMLRGYLDDSSDPARERVVVAGCCVASGPEWVKFEGHWKAILDREGIDYFRMSEFEAAKRSPYKHWTREKKTDVIEEMMHLIGDTARWVIAVAVNIPAWEARKADIQRRFGMGVDPFAFCALGCTMILQGMRLIERPVLSELALVFEVGNRMGWLEDTISLLRNQTLAGQGLPFIELTPKNKLLPVQAADIVAHEAYRSASQDWGYERFRRTRASMLNLFNNPMWNKHILTKLDADGIDDLASAVEGLRLHVRDLANDVDGMCQKRRAASPNASTEED